MMNKIKENHPRKKNKYSVKIELENIDWTQVEKIFFADKKLLQEKLEKEEDRKARNKEILKILAGGAVIALSFVIPTAPMALAPFIIDRNKFDQSTFNQSLDRLKKQKLVEIKEQHGQTIVRITDRGRVRALRYKLDEIQIKTPKVWDKKWRVIIFDIPEEHRRMRDIFRKHLKSMGFYMLQQSVWVHPYPCGNEIEFLRQVYNVGINVTYILAEKIENVEDLKAHFNI